MITRQALGNVTIRPMGTYSETTTYQHLDLVTYGNASYLAKKESTGKAPATNAEYWQLIAQGGGKTPSVDVNGILSWD